MVKYLLFYYGVVAVAASLTSKQDVQEDSHLWSRLKPSHSSVKRHKRSTDLIEEDSSQEDLPPLFQDDFQSEVEVKNLDTKESYMIHERVVRDSVWLRMTSKDDKTRTCSYSKLSGFGHTIYGLECLPAVNLPTGCFCSSGPSPTPYLPLTDLLALVAKKGVNHTKISVETQEFTTWQVKADNIHLIATFINDLNGSLEGISPFSISVTHNDTNPNYFSDRDQSCGNVRLDYTIHTWESPDPAVAAQSRTTKASSSSDSDASSDTNMEAEVSAEESRHSFELRPSRGGASIRNDWTIAPEGVFCQRPDIYRKKLPEIPDHFSVKIETIDKTQKAVTFSEEYYDFSEKLVSFEFAPRSHSPPAIFFSRFLINSGFPNDLYRIVHDFSAEVQYTLNERSGNCSMRQIPASASMQLSADSEMIGNNGLGFRKRNFRRRTRREENTILINTKEHQNAVLGSLRHVRLRHAKELLSVNPKKFVYSGTREIRGIPCDVWVAESLSNEEGQYSTIELYFSRPDYHILVEEVNSLSQLPLGMRTYFAPSKNSSRFENTITSHYYEFNPSRPMWKHFDVSSCLAQLDKLYLKVTLDVSYTLLVQFSLQKAHDSIRKAIAGISGISPLRISHLYLSTSPGNKEAIDVWFVMLERPNLYSYNNGGSDINKMYSSSSSSKPRPRLISISEGYRNLATLISQRDVPLKLSLNKDREVVARLRKHSLQVAPESVYPSNVHRGSYRFLRASYTAGSMAGLGFSMAILGICIGIFLGFLLWKRRLGSIPYYLSQ